MGSQSLNHRHILLTARGLMAPPRTAEEATAWLEELVRKVHMKILLGPFATRCATPGNEGVTGVVVIETSHASIHVWDEAKVPFLKMDLYSCADFSSQTIIDHLRRFSPEVVDYMVIDRNTINRVVEKATTYVREGWV